MHPSLDTLARPATVVSPVTPTAAPSTQATPLAATPAPPVSTTPERPAPWAELSRRVAGSIAPHWPEVAMATGGHW